LILKEEDCGINVADGDAAALAREILRLQGDSELAGRMGETLGERLEQRFTTSACRRRFHTLFGEILGMVDCLRADLARLGRKSVTRNSSARVFAVNQTRPKIFSSLVRSE